ncbi:MAG: sugar transferase [Syntrophobacteraceae bacterium]
MIRKSELVPQFLKSLDVGLTGIAFILTYFIKKHALPPPLGGLIQTPSYHFVLLLVLIIWYLTFTYFRLHENRRWRRYRPYFFELAKCVMISVGILVFMLFVLRIRDFSRLLLGIFFLVDLCFLAVSGWLVFKFKEARRKKQYFTSFALVIGTKLAAKDYIERLHESPEGNYRVLGCLTLNPALVGTTVTDGVSVIGTVDDLEHILRRQVVDEIVFSIPTDRVPDVEKYLVMAESTGIKIRILPHWHFRQFLAHRPKFYAMYFEEVQEFPTLVFAARSKRHGALFVKTLFDYFIGTVALIITLPLMAFIAVAIKFSSPGGPILFVQERLGLYGRTFLLYKFRTMIPHAETMHQQLAGLNEADGPAFKVKDDPRVIPRVGRFLRRTGLDELPQLFNVLRGEMSLVGPRPPIAEEVDRYELWERRRLSMKPGLTCLWQLQPNRNRIPFRRWLEMDLEYIDNWSLWLDLKIILKTLRAVLAGYGM